MTKYTLLLLLISMIIFSSCETEFIPEINNTPPEIVVEGHIEAGQNAIPPYVILTWSTPFFNSIDSNRLSNLFVHNAEVKVTVDGKEYPFTELCYNDLTTEQKQAISKLLNVSLDSSGLNFCVYVEPSFQLKGEIGKTYQLNINAEGKELNASTYIPEHVPLDSLWFTQPPGKPSDTLRRLFCYINDRPGIPDYYRYFTGINNGPLNPGFQSVTDDKFFDGLNFKFSLQRALEKGEEFDRVTYGLFHIGDTAVIKWANIDLDHYNFWNTLEFNRSNQGPFSSYTKVQTNVKGGLGIWGGYSISTYKLVVK